MIKKYLLIVVVFCTIVQTALAQSFKADGKVLSAEDGEPIVGATVRVTATNSGTITDIDGLFSIEVPENGTLTFSYIGLEPQTVKAAKNMVVKLSQDSKNLEEVVVTAVGIQRAGRSLGYSVTKVDADEAMQKAEPDLLRSLDGKIPGVQITSPSGVAGSATRITIRGNSSFLGNNQPLYVVDGVPYSNNELATSNQATEAGGAYGSGLSTLDPNDIESMNVLKGAAAAALYGSRAANGVVVITTKSGAKGKKRNAKGTEVTFNASYTIEKIAGLPDYQNSFGSGSNFIAGGDNGSWGASFDEVTEVPISIYSGNYQYYYPDMPSTIAYQAQKNNVKDLFETGGIYDVSVNINSYSEDGNFNVTLSRMQQDSYIPNADFGRYGISVGGNKQLANGLKVGGNVAYSRTDQNGPMFGNNQSNGIGASSFARALILGRNWDMSMPYETPDGASLFFVGSQADNPLWSWKYNKINTVQTRAVANANFSYDFTSWLSADYAIGINDFRMDRKEVLNLGSRALGGKGRIVNAGNAMQEIESNFLLRFKKNIDKVGINATLGHNVNQSTYKSNKVTGLNIMSPGIYNVDNTESQTASEYYERTRLWAVFGDVTIDYDNYLFLNVTGRNDFSSTLPEDNRSFFYPSTSLSFVFTEAFGIQNGIMNFGKVRGSWAKVGNTAAAYYKNGIYLLGQPYIGNSIQAIPDYTFDPNLKPEFTEEYEFGVDLQFFGGRIGIDATYYNRNSTDQIAPLSLPYSTGYTRYYTNFGKMNNHGVELGVNLVPVMTKNFKWDMFLNYTRNVSEVKELTEGLDRITLNTGFSSPTVVLEVGQPYGMLYGSKFARDDEGNYLVDPASGGYIEADEAGFLGDPNPKYKASMTNTFTYKGFSLSFLIDAQVGGCVYTSYVTDLLGRGVTQDTENRYGGRILPGYLADPTTKQLLLDANGNKIANTVQMTESDVWFTPGGGNTSTYAINAVDEAAVYDATVFRLRELTVGYDLPKKWLKGCFIGSANVAFVARNLFYYAPNVPKHSNYDPTLGSYGGGNVQGIDYTSAPNTRRYGFNVKLTF